MNRDEIVANVNSVFEVSFEIEENTIEPQMNIFEDLGLDSLDIVDLIVALQRKFNVKIRDDERVRDIRSVEDIYTFIGVLVNEGVIPEGE